MNQSTQKKEEAVNPDQIKIKPEPIEKWENEGGQIIPTGSLPIVVFPQEEEVEKDQSEEGEAVK